MSSYIPKGFQPIIPYFLVQDADAFLDFLRAAFGAEEISVHREEDRLVHAEIRVFGSVIEVGQPKGEFTATRANLHVYVPNPEEVMDQALRAGATLLYALTEHEYREKSGGIADPFGNQWYIACVTDHDKRSPSS
jgi:uncharacterized glyoxalase superfamily protein PhnB